MSPRNKHAGDAPAAPGVKACGGRRHGASTGGSVKPDMDGALDARCEARGAIPVLAGVSSQKGKDRVRRPLKLPARTSARASLMSVKGQNRTFSRPALDVRSRS